MLKAPFFKVYIDNDSKRDITEMIESFVYEDSMQEDNLLKITIASTGLDAVNDNDFLTGVILAVQFGYKAREVSEIHRVRITDRTPKYAQRVTIQLKCLDLGTTIKKVIGGKIWENQTSTEIAQTIATKYNLELEADTTTKVWEALPQGNMSDLDFVKSLAQKEGSGNYISYIRNTTLYFVNRATENDSILTLTYGDGNGKILSFTPTLKESSQKPESNKTNVSYVDTLEAKVKNSVVDSTTERDTGTLGTVKRLYDENGQQLSSPVGLVKNLVIPVQDEEEAESVANATKKESTLSSQVAKLKIEGNPLLTPNNVLTIKGVAIADAGNWLIVKVVHTISPSGYTSNVSLQKNGSKRKLTQNATKAVDANNSIGTEEGINQEVKLRVYNGQGEFQGYSSNDRNATKNR